MARADKQIIYYNGNEISKSPKNAVAYNILKHMVEKLNYKFEKLEEIFNNSRINIGTVELVKRKENISNERDRSDKDEFGNSRTRQNSYLPRRETPFLKCKDNNGNIVEFGVWTEWEYKNFPKFKAYIESLKLGYKIEEISDKKETNLLYNNKIEQKNEEVIYKIWNYINNKGFEYDLNCIKNIYLSLKTKPFVILSGISGTGKSKLVKLLAESLGSTSENGRFTLIPVRPDWSDSSELLGYKDLNGTFHPGILTTVIEEASKEENKNYPYFVCLDEMNLARVEYYLSDILSVIESRDRSNDGEIKTDKLIRKELLGNDQNAIQRYSNFYIPENIYIIGTVNMDETTFPFSKKVLDRANTIEFNEVNLEFNFDLLDDKEEVEIQEYTNSFLKSKYIKLIDCKAEKDKATKIINQLIKINKILERYNQHFGYRVRDEIVYYCLYALEDKLLTFEEAIDYCIVQKILPKIGGSDEEILDLLIDLYNELNDTKYTRDDFDINRYIKASDIYKLTNKRILIMVRRFVRDGFTNFWQ